MNVVAQFFGIAAIMFWAYSIQKKEQYKILFLQALANIAYTIQYVLLGVYSAASMNFMSFIRSGLFCIKRKKNKEISKVWLIFFCILVVIFGVLTYENYLSLIPLVITLFYTISSWMENSNWLRIVFLIAAFVWVYYNYTVGAYVCILGNVIEIISAITSLIRFSKSK